MNPFIPTLRDWPEDHIADPDNGAYMCTCCACHATFAGHKRRVVCKECATKDKAESKRRAEWLTEHKAPMDWVILTTSEVAAIKADYAVALLCADTEREARRELAEPVGDLLFQIDCVRNMCKTGFSIHHPLLKDIQAALDKAVKMDEEKSLSTPAPSRDIDLPS